MKKLSVALCVPSTGEWQGLFCESLAKAQAFFFQHPVPDYEVVRNLGLYHRVGSGISILREGFVEAAIERGDSHILMIDTDQTFPPDTIHRLLFHKKAAVACNIATKTIPSSPTARKKTGTPFGAGVYSDGKHGLEQVWRVGCGIMLLEVETLKKLGSGLFEFTWDPEAKDYRGEDWSLCKKLEEAGVPVYVDHDLSRQIGHVGTYIYTHRDILNPEKIKAA